LEAGRRDRLGITRLPAALLRTIGNRRYDWAYTSEPDPTRNGQAELWPRGRTLGGSSAINGMIYVRGAPADYDAWEALGCTGWGWRDVLPLFRRLETADAPDATHRGGCGPQRVSALRWRHPLAADFIASGIAAGIPPTNDLNGPRHEGIGWNQGSTIEGRRHSAFDAFLAPILERPNLTVLDDVLVVRLTFAGRRATGLEARRGGAPLRVVARRGVVLAAGAINSPQLLMMSASARRRPCGGTASRRCSTCPGSART
jgi:choline dehydrogenase